MCLGPGLILWYDLSNGKETLVLILRKWDVGGLDWIELAQDRDRWRALVSTVMNFGVP
jgi:hypothetical protein